MNKTEEKLINDHWGYIWRLLVYHQIDVMDRIKAATEYKLGFRDGLDGKQMRNNNFHYLTAYEHGQKHAKEQ